MSLITRLFTDARNSIKPVEASGRIPILAEYVEAFCTAQTSASSSAFTNVTGCSLTLSPGVWLIGYDAAVDHSGSNVFGGMAIRTGSTVITNTESAYGSSDTAGNRMSNLSRRTKVVVSSPTTYVLSARASTGTMLVYSTGNNPISGFSDGADVSTTLWAQRVG